MINKLQELKDNFAKYKQGFCSLVDKNDQTCLCAEGILGITTGYSIKKNEDNGMNSLYFKWRYYYNNISDKAYTELNLPEFISGEFLLKYQTELELTKKQVK
jgi:hypothetical protein